MPKRVNVTHVQLHIGAVDYKCLGCIFRTGGCGRTPPIQFRSRPTAGFPAAHAFAIKKVVSQSDLHNCHDLCQFNLTFRNMLPVMIEAPAPSVVDWRNPWNAEKQLGKHSVCFCFFSLPPVTNCHMFCAVHNRCDLHHEVPSSKMVCVARRFSTVQNVVTLLHVNHVLHEFLHRKLFEKLPPNSFIMTQKREGAT